MTEFNEELRKYEKNNKYRCGYGYGDEHVFCSRHIS